MYSLTTYNRNRNNDLFNPFRALDEMERDFFRSDALAAMKTDIRDAGNSFILEADLPGFKKEDIHVDLDDQYLTIHAERHSATDDKKDNYLKSERTFGSFTRSFSTEGIDTSNIRASYENGVLTLELPKQAPKVETTRRLEIQ
ncbi:MAG: Hsp20/alpha crystallin family protein [Candidatus Avoscillospira sp.]